MQPSKRSRWQELAALEGLISEETGVVLATLAAEVPAHQVILEVGSFKGKSTAYLAEGSRLGNGARVIAVDPWDLQPAPGKHDYNNPDTRKAFDSQLRKVDLRSLITARKSYSKDAAAKYKDEPIGLLYIDGDHNYESVAEDFTVWTPHLSTEPVVVFDDYGTRNRGVTRFVDEMRHSGWKVDLSSPPLAVVRVP